MICDGFLILSLETMCVRWHLREDVAGATFMALGSAAPEIVVNMVRYLNSAIMYSYKTGVDYSSVNER